MTPSHLLILNAAEGAIQIVLAREEQGEESPRFLPLHFSEWHAPSQGAELLVPALAGICARLDIAPRSIRRIACVNGPGSFTGIRLVLGTAAGLARTCGATQAGMALLPLLAQGAARLMRDVLPVSETAEQQESPVFWVLTHARRNLVHMQGFTLTAGDCGNQDPLALAPMQDATGLCPVRPEGAAGGGSPPVDSKDATGLCPVRPEGVAGGGSPPVDSGDIQTLSLEDAAARIQRERGTHPGFLLGSGITRNRDFWREAVLGPGTRFLPDSLDRPGPDVLLRAASALSYGTEDVQPLYVRPCDAEENLTQIAQKLGLDPEQSRNALDHFTRSPASSGQE